MSDEDLEESILSPGRALRALAMKVNSGDAQALGELRETLDENPAIWQRIGDLGAHAEHALITLVAGNDQLVAESLRRKLGSLRAELAGTGPVSALEKLAIDRVVTCSLQVSYLDLKAASPSGSRANDNFWRRAQDQAHRRYLGAMRSLITVRQLAPAVPWLAKECATA